MSCLFGRHRWDGCVCTRCGETRHSFEIVGMEEIDGPGCCWDVSSPCVGPHCGTPCNSYYPRRAGEIRVTLRCRVCGRTEERTDCREDARIPDGAVRSACDGPGDPGKPAP